MTIRILPSITEPVRAPSQGGKRDHWSGRELQVIRERYIAEGVVACAALLPDRTPAAITEKALKMGLRRQGRHAKPLPPTPQLDEAIRRLYAEDAGSGRRGWLKQFCERHKVPRHWVYQRAQQMGIVPDSAKKAPPWTEAEHDLLERNAHKHPETIRKIFAKAGYRRTESAIAVRRKRIIGGVRQARVDAGVYSANDVAELMRVDVHCVMRWIGRDGLKAKVASWHSNGRAERYEITRGDLRRWMLTNTHAWDHRRIDKLWLIDVLTNGASTIAQAGLDDVRGPRREQQEAAAA